MSLATRKAIYGKLAGDTTLNALLGSPASGYSKAIYYNQAPTGAAFPFVVFNKPAGAPVYTFKVGTAAMDEEIWEVKGIDHSTTADAADNIASRLDALLTDGALSISGRTQLYLRRESDVDYSEVDDGERYVYAGAQFRLVTQ